MNVARAAYAHETPIMTSSPAWIPGWKVRVKLLDGETVVNAATIGRFQTVHNCAQIMYKLYKVDDRFVYSLNFYMDSQMFLRNLEMGPFR